MGHIGGFLLVSLEELDLRACVSSPPREGTLGPALGLTVVWKSGEWRVVWTRKPGRGSLALLIWHKPMVTIQTMRTNKLPAGGAIVSVTEIFACTE